MDQTNMLFALIAYAFVTTVTPGPNNTMLLSSGSRFGFARTVPHIFGILFGVAVMIGTLGLGLAGVFATHEGLRRVLAVISFGWIVWLAFKLATAPTHLEPKGEVQGKPISFLAAATFQWVNPKAWAMVLGALGTWGAALGTPTVMAAFALAGLPCIAIWAAAGQGLRRWLSHPGRLRAFNIGMALLLVASMLPTLWG